MNADDPRRRRRPRDPAADHHHARDVGGFRLEEAGGGLQALVTAAGVRPEIVFLDYEMPDLDGAETCRRLRSDPVTADATIIMLTGMSDGPAQARAVDAGRHSIAVTNG